MYTNRRKWPISAVLGHLCTLLRLARIVRATVGTQECTQMGGSGLSAPLWGVCVHCCDTSRNTNRDASCVRWHERLSHHGVPAAPPRWPLPLGREDRLCASGAAARLASSPRRQPTRTPEEHKKWANALWRWPANVSGGPAGVRTLDLGIKSLGKDHRNVNLPATMHLRQQHLTPFWPISTQYLAVSSGFLRHRLLARSTSPARRKMAPTSRRRWGSLCVPSVWFRVPVV